MKYKTISELAECSVTFFRIAKEEIDNQIAELQKEKNKLQKAILLKYENEIEKAKLQKGKDTGIVDVQDGNHKIRITYPLRVKWEQETMRDLILDDVSLENVPSFVKIELSIHERDFKELDKETKEKYSEARIESIGKERIEIVEVKDE